MQLSGSHKPRSISRTLSVSLIITLVVVAAMSLGLNFILASRRARAELETKVEEFSSALTDALRVPLWNFSEETIAAICTSYAKNDLIAELLLEDQKGAVLFKKEKADQAPVVSRSQEIYYEGNLIGRIHIGLASGYYTALNRQLFKSLSLTTIIMIGTLLVMTGVLLRQFLKKPMARFIKMVDTYADGQTNAFKQDIPYSEFHPLVGVLDEMGEKIESQMNSLKLIQYAVDNSSVATYRINPDARITYVNMAACRNLGYSQQELVKLSLTDIDPRWPAERWPQMVENLKAKGSLTFESVHRRKDGSTFPVEMTATFLVFKGQEHIFAFAGDITHREQAEAEIRKLNQDLEKRVAERTEALRESRTKYRDLVENANSIIFQMDTQCNITFCNQFALDFFGYSEEEILGRNVVGTIVPATESTGRNLETMFQELVNDPEKHAENENENIRRNGELAWVTWTNRAIYDEENRLSEILCIGIDRTEQKQMEEEIRRNMDELERFNKLATGREIKMIQLKEEINELLVELNQEKRYKIVT